MHTLMLPAAISFGASYATVTTARIASACLSGFYSGVRRYGGNGAWSFNPAPVSNVSIAAILTVLFWVGHWTYRHLL